MGSDESRATGIDTSVPHSARIWNYWLGGKDNYEVDRQAGDELVKLMPDILTAARETRAFLIIPSPKIHETRPSAPSLG